MGIITGPTSHIATVKGYGGQLYARHAIEVLWVSDIIIITCNTWESHFVQNKRGSLKKKNMVWIKITLELWKHTEQRLISKDPENKQPAGKMWAWVRPRRQRPALTSDQGRCLHIGAGTYLRSSCVGKFANPTTGWGGSEYIYSGSKLYIYKNSNTLLLRADAWNSICH